HYAALCGCLLNAMTLFSLNADVSINVKNGILAIINSSVEGKLAEKSVCFEASVLEKLNQLTDLSYEVKTFAIYNNKIIKPMIIAKSNRLYELLSGLKFVTTNGEIEDVGFESFANKLSTGGLKFIDSSKLPISPLSDGNITGKCVSSLLVGNKVATYDLSANGDKITLKTKTMGASNFSGSLIPTKGGFDVVENFFTGKNVKRDVRVLGEKKILIDRYFCEIL
ncbi:MAG: hypothetical protein K2Q18_15910, partial [Bdellovibrionales bacterium]|nr:hypothetical protein [Bdellovibrionales bacterium]